jgi:putative hydrolase of the HAD superfamily
MKYQAVIFDLFGTLIPSFSERGYQKKVKEIASVMQASPEDFWKQWSATLKESMLGSIPSLEAKIVHICQRLGVRPDALEIRKAEEMFYEYEAKYMLPRPEAEEVISQLKTCDLKIGLISDCSSEGPELWKKTALAPYFDVSIFSCSVGLQKPDPRIYQMALQQLAVKAQNCLYVGDGGSMELTGASKAGLDAVQLRIPGENGPDVFRINKEDWQGTIITSLKEVLVLIFED